MAWCSLAWATAPAMTTGPRMTPRTTSLVRGQGRSKAKQRDGAGPSPEPWCLRSVLLSRAQAVCLLQPGLHGPHLDCGEPPAAVGWGGKEGGREGWGACGRPAGLSYLHPHQSLEAGQGNRALPLLGLQLPTLWSRAGLLPSMPPQAPAAGWRPSGPDLQQQQWGPGVGSGLSTLPGIS